MTTYASTIYNYVGRRLSWSANSDQPQRPSSHDLLAASHSRSERSSSTSRHAHTHHRALLLSPHLPPLSLSTVLRPPSLDSLLDPAEDAHSGSDRDDAASEQMLVAAEYIPAGALCPLLTLIPDAGDPASNSRDLGAGTVGLDNSLINNATLDFDHPTTSPPERSSQAQTSASPVRPQDNAQSPQSSSEEMSLLTSSSNNIHVSSNDDSNTMKPSTLPEDDGKRALRLSLVEIHKMNITEREKAKRMHALMTEKYNALRERKRQSKQAEISPSENPLEVTSEDAKKSYHKENQLGCAHYKRSVKLQCSTCQKWHTCRFCHDEVEDHNLIRRETKNMLCMHCGKAQPAQQECRHCGAKSARYYCDKCKLWDDDPEKKIYHCDDCGICRIGAGLGKDFFHCKKCGVCMSIRLQEYHRCIERSTECDCPICGEFMFTSTLTVVFMKCGHSIHHKCYYEHMKSSYRCPTCYRTIINMESQFRALDNEIANQVLPAPYDAWRSLISCNDCSARSNVPFHFLGLKCETCRSYNTNQVRLIRPEEESGYATSPLGSDIDSSMGRRSNGATSAGAVGRHRSGNRGSTGAGVGGTPTLLAATAALVSADVAINLVTSSTNPTALSTSTSSVPRLLYEWDFLDDDSGSMWSRNGGSESECESGGEESAPDEEVGVGGLVPGLEGLLVFADLGGGRGDEEEEEEDGGAEGEGEGEGDGLEDDDDDEEEDDDFLNLTGHR